MLLILSTALVQFPLRKETMCVRGRKAEKTRSVPLISGTLPTICQGEYNSVHRRTSSVPPRGQPLSATRIMDSPSYIRPRLSFLYSYLCR